MKFNTLSLLLLTAATCVSTSLAFTPANFDRHANTKLYSTSVAEQQSTTITDSSSTTSKPRSNNKFNSNNPTRFDRLKQLYKGPKFQVSDEAVSFSYDEFTTAVENTRYEFERNKVVQGVAVEYTGGGCLVDIGAKASAFLPDREVSIDSEKSVEDAVPLDTPLKFQIISEEDENGQLLVSVKRIEFADAWDNIIKLAEKDDPVEVEVVATNRGGAICMLNQLRAFLPGSHVAGMMVDDDMIGKKLKVKFLEVDQPKGRLVVSHRKAMVEAHMASFSRGDVVTGTVKFIKDFGAFVEVGSVICLLHISQISQDHVRELEKVLQPGMQIKCMILDHDKENGRIALNTKSLEYEAGMMLTNPQAVFDRAEETAALYHENAKKERESTKDTARDIVENLSASDDITGGSSSDPLQDVTDSIESLLS